MTRGVPARVITIGIILITRVSPKSSIIITLLVKACYIFR